MELPRREFLVSISAAAGATAMWNWVDDNTQPLRWCRKPAYPLCEKRLRVSEPIRGKVECRLQYLAPDSADWLHFEPRSLVCNGPITTLSIRLPNVHKEYIPGQHIFVATVQQGERIYTSTPIEYDLRPFLFGA